MFRPLLDVSLPLYVPDPLNCGPTTAPCHPRHTLPTQNNGNPTNNENPPNNGSPTNNGNPRNNRNPQNVGNPPNVGNLPAGTHDLTAGNKQQLVDPWKRKAAERPLKLLVFLARLDTQLQHQMQTLRTVNFSSI